VHLHHPSSAKVAQAAAYVVSETLTVEDFFKRGAAIGIQMKQSPPQGKPAQPMLWDNSGPVLLDLHERPEVVLAVRNRDEFQLICDPFYERLPHEKKTKKGETETEEEKYVTAWHSYDLIYLGRRTQGTWSFKLSLECSNDQMWLILHQQHKRRKEFPWKHKRTLRLPLYFDGNSGCVQVGERNKTIEELNLGLHPQPNEVGELAADAPAGESDQEPDSDQGSILPFNHAADSDVEHWDVESSISGNSGVGHGGGQLSAQQHDDDIWDFHGLPSPSPPRVVSDIVKPDRKGYRLSPYEQAWKRRKTSKEI
jgi:hypothetical protein